jgi:exodeoxyribonuclease V beta subunit
MEFDFSLEHGIIEELNRALDRNAGKPLEPIEYDDFEGIVTGIIDLVFEHEGCFYLVDYKTNFLGATLDDYRPDKLEDEIFDRRYDLQYLLYSVALHRYLRQRLPSYRYETHFGGVYYLFLRAMRPADTDSRGIFYVRPDPEIIEVLDRTVFAPSPAAAPSA